MRVVLDTNVLLSGLLWHGSPHALIERARDNVLVLISSPDLLAELARIIARPKFDAILVRTQTSRKQVLIDLRQLVEVVEPAPLPHPICRDPDDDAVLALAIAANADLIVSGDQDLLSLESFHGIAIVTPNVALTRLETN